MSEQFEPRPFDGNPLNQNPLATEITREGIPSRGSKKPMGYFTADWQGTTSYITALSLQEGMLEQVKPQNQGVVLGLEHPKVITLGIRGQIEKDLYRTPTELKSEGFQLASIRRGGQATLHSPGQLVIYPILPIKNWGLGVREYIRILENVCLTLLADLGVSATTRCEKPGIYSSRGKLIFFGVQISRGVSFHGLALNLKNDLSLFQNIRSCGQTCETFDRLSDHGIRLESQTLFELWCKRLDDHLRNSLSKTHLNHVGI